MHMQFATRKSAPTAINWTGQPHQGRCTAANRHHKVQCMLSSAQLSRRQLSKFLFNAGRQLKTSTFRMASAVMAEPTTAPSTGIQSQPMLPNLTGLIQRAKECNTGLEQLPTLTPLVASGVEVGKLKPSFVAALVRFPDVFKLRGEVGPTGQMQLSEALASVEERSAAVAGVLAQLRDEGVIRGWRDELYPVLPSFYSPPLLLAERAAATHLGIKAYGVHVNGYVEDAKGQLHLWVARRSLTKPNWPGKLDHIVAGGQPHGISCLENVVKECGEEAGVPRDLALTARAVGAVSYTTISDTGYKPDVLFCYDLRLPADFVPVPQDGEVESFQLLPIAAVARLVANTNEFKTNCNLVIIDFMLRHGCIAPEQAGYLDLVRLMRSGDCS